MPLAAILLFAACRKDESATQAVTVNSVNSDVLLPLPCHAVAFASDYPVVPGEVPPFRFSKTQYADGRIRSISMSSRRFPNYPTFPKQAVELSGNLSYATNTGFFKGTREVWEYYLANGVGARRLISKRDLSYRFDFTPEGFCNKVSGPDEGGSVVLSVNYDADSHQISFIGVSENADLSAGAAFFYPSFDQYGNVLRYDQVYSRWGSILSYTYDYSKPRGSKNYNYIPSQNWISSEFNLLEVMQWVPQAMHQRKGVSVTFYPYETSTYPFNTGKGVTQSQTYSNFKFDARGNQTYLTYGDNVAQRTTWVCQ